MTARCPARIWHIRPINASVTGIAHPMKTISNLKVGTKISLFAFVLSSVILTSLILVIGYTTSALVEKRSFDEIAKVEQGVVNMIAIFNQTADSDVSRFSKLLASSFPGEFTLDPARTVPIAGKPVTGAEKRRDRPEPGILGAGRIHGAYRRDGDDLRQER